MKNFIKSILIRYLYPKLLSYPDNFEKLLASSVGVYLQKSEILELDKSLNKFYQEVNIDYLKDKINYEKELLKLNNQTPKIDILVFKNPCKSLSLSLLSIWERRLSLLRFCSIRIDLLLLNKDQQIPPHAHRGVLSGFMLLEGEVSIRHFHAQEYKQNGIVCKKTVDKTLSVGGYTTNHDTRDNIHWLRGVAGKSILFRFNITGLKSNVPEYNNLGSRVYIDPSDISEVYKLAPFLSPNEVKALKF